MKKVYILSTLLVLTLSACGAVSSPAAQAADPTVVTGIVSSTQTTFTPVAIVASTSTGSTTLNMDYENAVPVPMQLMIGVLQLEGTSLAITSEQATSLLASLISAKDLIANNSISEEQISSLTEQVQAILSDEQIQAIARMQITQETAMSFMQQQGNAMGNSPVQGDVPQGTPPAGAQNGQPPGGDRNQRSMGFIPPQLIDTLIQLLQSKTTAS